MKNFYRKKYKSFGEEIRRRRKDLNLTQARLAERADTDQTYISDLENGKLNPTLDRIIAVSEALETHPGSLFSPYEEPRIDPVILRLAKKATGLLKKQKTRNREIILRIIELLTKLD